MEYQNNYFSIFKVVDHKKDIKTKPSYQQFSEKIFPKQGSNYYDTEKNFYRFLDLCGQTLIEADAEYKLGNNSNVITLLEPLIQLFSCNPHITHTYVSALMRMGYFSKAKIILDNLLIYRTKEDFIYNPGNRALYQQKAAVLFKLKSYSDAISVLKELLNYTNESKEKKILYFALSKNYEAMGDAIEAQKYFQLVGAAAEN